MKPEIELLNRSIRNQADYMRLLVDYYISGKITIDDIFNNKESGFIINADFINVFAVKINDGLDNIPRNLNLANQLYQIAINAGSTLAKRNLAINLIMSSDSTEPILVSAIKLLDEATKANNVIKNVEYYFGLAYLKLRKFDRAYFYLNKVPEKADNQTNTLYQQAVAYLAQYTLLPGIPGVLLDRFFVVAGTDIVPSVQGLKLENAKKVPSWYMVSADFDAFDMNDEKDIILAFRKAKVELEQAVRGKDAINEQIMQAKSEGNLPVIIEALELQKKEIEKQLKDKQEAFNVAEGYYNNLSRLARNKEYRRQMQTEKHFFSPQRTHSISTRDLAKVIQRNRFAPKQEEVQAIDGENIPVRRLITADLATIHASLQAFGRMGDYQQKFGWRVALQKSGNGYYSSYTQDYGNTETVKLATAEVQYYQRINVHSNHVGDFYMINLGTYGQIYNLLTTYTGSVETPNRQNEKMLAQWMFRYTRTGTVITLAELKTIYPNAEQSDINNLMRIVYHCTVKEPMSWMMAASGEHELPYATSQARAIRLISEGFITLKDVFSADAPYGIFTGQNIGADISKVREKIDRINETYNQCILNPKVENLQACFLFKRAHVKGQFVTTRATLHKELRDTYGGSEDSDGDGYDSDTAEKLYKGPFEFT